MATSSDGVRPSAWTARQVAAGGWIRRMFAEGRRLRALHGEGAVVDLALGQPLAPSGAVRRAFAAAVAETEPGRFAYMANVGYPDVRERVAAEVGFAGVTERSIAMTCGAAGAISIALRVFLEAGDEVVGIAPYFSEFPLYCETAGLRFLPVPSRDDLTLDPEALAAALTGRTAAVILNTPANPSGHVLTEGELRAVAEVLDGHARRTGRPILLIVDEAYHGLVYPPARRTEVLSLHPHTVLARSFSKDLGIAGERLGYLVLHPELTTPEIESALAVCTRALGYVNAPATAQRALLHLPSFQPDVERHRTLRDHAVSRAREAGLDVPEPDGALYLWARSPWPDTITFVEALAERRVLVTPGVAFGVPGRIRLCFSVAPAGIDRAMEAIEALIGSRGADPAAGGKGGIRTPGGASHPSPA